MLQKPKGREDEIYPKIYYSLLEMIQEFVVIVYSFGRAYYPKSFVSVQNLKIDIIDSEIFKKKS